MKTRRLFHLVIVLSCLCIGCIRARADMGMFESVEWMTAMADQIGIYHCEKIYGPHSVTNDPQHWSCCFFTADFKLEKGIRGNPSPTYSRTSQVDKPELLGFHAGNTYIFFLVAEERLKNVRANVHSTAEAFFSREDHLWLERPPGTNDAAAIDHNGNILTNRDEIVKLVESSLKLPRASAGIDRGAYFYRDSKEMYPDGANFNFKVLDFPTRDTPVQREPWARNIEDWCGLVIPLSLYQETSTNTNMTPMPATNRVN